MGLIVRPSSRRHDPRRDAAAFRVVGAAGGATGRRRKAGRRGEGKERNSEFIDQRRRLAVSRPENSVEKKRDYGNPMAVSLFHVGAPHNLRTYEPPHCALLVSAPSLFVAGRAAARLGGCHLPRR